MNLFEELFMKVLFVDTAVSGHHVSYLSSLLCGESVEPVLVLPEKLKTFSGTQYLCKYDTSNGRTFRVYWKWINDVLKIAKKEQPDVIHFLYGDVFYRYFGVGLRLFKQYKTIVTLHWAKSKPIEIISTKMICSQIDKVVVHSDYIKQSLKGYGVKNAEHIEYPQFNKHSITKQNACRYWGLREDVPTILCMGNTRYDKGLDILLDALKSVNVPFQLLIAGKEESFDKGYIEKEASPYLDRVKLCLHFLSDEELANAFGVSDIVVLPYRLVFNGASGPLGEGVALEKCIVGPDHGTLGYTIRENHLGYTFESENRESLAIVLNEALSMSFVMDDKYKSYRDSLDPKKFSEKYEDVYNSVNKNVGG